MSTRRDVLAVFRRRRPEPDAGAPTTYWGHIGQYEAVTRNGILLLLSPEARHPSLQVAETGITAPANRPTGGARKAS